MRSLNYFSDSKEKLGDFIKYVDKLQRHGFTLLCSLNSKGFQKLMPRIRFVTVKLYY